MRAGGGFLLLSLCLFGCGDHAESSGANGVPPEVSRLLPTPYAVTLRVVDEAGLPPPGAALEADGAARTLDAQGRATLGGLVEPLTVVARAPGFLPEPAVLGPEDGAAEVVIRLRSAAGRAVVHVGGALMLGRRFVDPEEEDTCVVRSGDGGSSARAAVASLAPLFRAASLRVANVETVIGSRPASEAYPGKSFVFQSIPETVAALNDLGLDVAGLANDHARDWLEPGLADTLAALRAANILPVGAGLTDAEAAAPVTVDVDGLKIGVLAYSSIWGDYANDAYPAPGTPAPVPLPPGDAFKYEERVWGYGSIPVQARRIRGAWEELKAAGITAASWASATAVYPELQDWVARRGHGGANSTSSARMPGEIAALRSSGCDVVLVMTHSGHEFAEAAGESALRHARAAVDAGADVVVHHARVPQGFEFYKGKLICRGLGNALSDQDVMDSFLSGVLRLVFEGSTLLEARYLPITLLRYRPAPLAGRMARRALRQALERSAIDAHTVLVDGVARAVLAPLPADAIPAALREDGRVEPWTGAVEPLSVVASFEAPAELPERGLTRSRGAGGASLPGLLFGRDLLRWGAFEDDAADGIAAGGPQWKLSGAPPSAGVPVTDGAPSGTRALHLARGASNTTRVRLRPVAKVPLRARRFWTADGGVPADGPATYSLSFQARRSGSGACRFTLDVYGDGQFLRSQEIAFEVPADDAWHGALLDLPSGLFAPALGVEPDGVIVYVGLHPPASGVSELRMDDLRLLEWRSPNLMPDGFYEATVVRSTTSGAPVTLTLQRRPE